MKQPLVYIILLVWNGYEDTIECIQSIKKINYNNYKIVVVDNASTNDSVSILKKKFPNLIYIVNDNNLGFAGGCNVGIKYALVQGADYILLQNNDTTVDKYFLANLIEVGEKDGKVGILSPFIYHANDRMSIWSSGAEFVSNNLWPFFDKYKNRIEVDFPNIIRDVDFVTGCSMLIKSSLFRKIGYLREEYFMYFEDMDYCIRAKNANFRINSVISSKVWHEVGATSLSLGNPTIRYYFARNKIFFYKYNYSGLMRLKNILRNLMAQLVEALVSFKNKSYLTGWYLLRGTIDGIYGKTGELIK